MNCPRCYSTILEEGAQVCPDCGCSVKKSGGGSQPFVLIQNYFGNLVNILFRPTQFFKNMPTTGGLAGPLAFALVTHWIGAAVGYLWRNFFDLLFGGQWRSLFQVSPGWVEIDTPARQAQWAQARDHVMDWFWGMGSVIADPFTTLAMLLVTSLLVYVGARLFVSDSEGRRRRDVTFESATRLVAYGMSPAILAVFPVVGGVAAQIWAIVVTVIGARTVYRVSTPRALVIALFPKLLLLGIIFLGVAAFFLLFVRFLFGML